MQRSEEVPLAVAVILPFSADTTTSAHYTSWRIRRRHMGRKEKMKNVNQCCRTLISRGLDHSHWFFCLSVCTACGVERSGGRCLHRRWLLCWTEGLPRSGWYVFNRHLHLRMEVCALCSSETDSLGRSAETLRCNLLCNGPKCLLSVCLCIWLRSFYLHVSRLI